MRDPEKRILLVGTLNCPVDSSAIGGRCCCIGPYGETDKLNAYYLSQHQRKHDECHADGAGSGLIGIAFAVMNAMDGAEGEDCADERGGESQNE